MTYPNDPDTRESSYAVWIVGTIVVIVLIIGSFVVYNRFETQTAGNSPNPPSASRTAPAPSTTGSGAPTTPAGR
jgi:hypothetical protein